MNESEWLECQKPSLMLDHLRTSGRASDRKLRCFVLACGYRYCRYRGYPVRQRAVIEDWCKRTIRLAEDRDDGDTTLQELERLLDDDRKYLEIPLGVGWDVGETIRGNIAWWVERFATPARTPRDEAAMDAATVQRGYAERAFQSDLLRDLFGPQAVRPFSFVSVFTPFLCSLASQVYKSRSPDGTLVPALLTQLAAALEDAGYADAELLSHLREDRTHYRGCWVVDAILGLR